jgi:hypothetical protein
LVLAALCGQMAACSPSVNRKGYVAINAADAKSCQVAVQVLAKYSGDEAEELGSVEVGDAGFTTKCDEERMVGLLRGEGCSAGADVVDIVDEKRPDLSSTCWRATALLLRFRDPSRTAADDPRFAAQALQARTKADDHSQHVMIWTAVIVGVVVGATAGIITATR